MSELLKLAESYYAVAKDLERQAQHYLDVAKMLNRCADNACEQNMREQPHNSGEVRSERVATD